MYRKSFILFLIIFSCVSVFGQSEEPPAEQKIDYLKLSAIGGITFGGLIYGHILQSQVFWNDKKTSFHFNWRDDWTYALGSDKYGHFYFPYLVTNIYTQALEWSGIEKERSIIYSASFAFAYQTYVEIFDGITEDLGFSWGDFAANTLGAAYPYLQYKIKPLENFGFKISYEKSERFKQGSHRHIIDDYESTYNWLSINVYNFLPDNIKNYYPSFINFAIGHSVKNLNSTSGGNHEIFIGLDWNLEALPGDFWLLKLLKKNLNYYHFPAPSIKIYPGVVWYGLKF
jgi:uncharacterized protein YfiM (DUF2279 family)